MTRRLMERLPIGHPKKRRSDISGFHKLDPSDRLEAVRKFSGLSVVDTEALLNGLSITTAEHMIENVVGVISLPLGIATNFLVDGKDYLVPMAIEESSVVAAASNAAKMCRPTGGFATRADPPMMIGQIQLSNVSDPHDVKARIDAGLKEIMDVANIPSSTLVKMGGGLKEIDVRRVERVAGPMIVVHLLVDVRDAMGANAVNTISERVAPIIERLTGGSAGLKIVSNLATSRLARASAVWSRQALVESFKGVEISGEEIEDRIISAWRFAVDDIYRCATHNKGIMNGVDAVLIACGNDWRAVEAGAHTYSRVIGSPLTRYEKLPGGGIRGHIELPLSVGTIGGATKINPGAHTCLKVLGTQSSTEFARVIAAVGLANNFAALRALATEGIQRGHMKLHATNIAVEAGCHGKEIEVVAEQMISEKNVNVSRAKEILVRVREQLLT